MLSESIIPWLPLVSAIVSLISAIVGGLIVAFANHLFQKRRDWTKYKNDKAEVIAHLVGRLIWTCEYMTNRVYVFRSREQPIKEEEILSEFFSKDGLPQLRNIMIEIGAMVVIHHKSRNKLADRASEQVAQFAHALVAYTDYLRGQMKEEPRLADIDECCNATTDTAFSLRAAVLTDTERSTTSLFRRVVNRLFANPAT